MDKILDWSKQFSGKKRQEDVNLQDMLEDLRKNLRKELGLQPINRKIRYVKFYLQSEIEKKNAMQ